MTTKGYPLMRLLLAARLSRLGKNETGIDTQDEDAREWATRNGHTIVGVCPDHISGRVSPFDRRELGPWLTDPNRMAMYDGILISKIDRLTRKRDWDIRQWAEENDKKLLCVFPELTWPPPPGDMITATHWDMLVNQAASEWDNTSQRYRRMQKGLRELSYFVGQKPYGYRIVCAEQCERGEECKHHKTLEPDPVTSAIVRGMAKRYLDGQSMRQIRDWLTSIATPAPRPPKDRAGKGWTAQAVSRVLRNPAIIGRVQGGGKTVLRVEPIISVEDYLRIQDMIQRRATRGASTETALLTSILRCKDDKPMYRHISGGGIYYYCDVDTCPKGERMMVPLVELDNEVHEAVMSMANQEHIITTVIPGDTYGEEINQIKGEMKALDPEAYEDDGKYFAELAVLREEIRRLRSMPRKAARMDTKADGKTVGEVWESLDTAGRRRWLLARRGSNWLPGQDRVRVQVLGRDDELSIWITDIDLGEYTDATYSLATL